MELGTIHKEKRERIQDKNKIIEALNKKIASLNEEILILNTLIREKEVNVPPLSVSILEDKGTHLEAKSIIRQSRVRSGYEFIVV